jgi:hypothetical protein
MGCCRLTYLETYLETLIDGIPVIVGQYQPAYGQSIYLVVLHAY